MKRAISILAPLFALALAGAALAAEPAGKADDGMPKERHYSYGYDILDHSVARPATRLFDVALLARKLTGNPREAANLDADDQVRLPSTWWQPRVGFRPVSPEQMIEGPGEHPGPAPGPWTVTKAKTQGVTPGFQIKDSKGDKFFIKFDPPANPELSTGAEVVGTHLFWAAGYNVPENSIAWFRLEDLEIGKDAKYTDARGKSQPITMAYLQDLLSHTASPQGGRYRCVASRFLEGKPIGPFEYRGRRKDDPEDLIPHQLRRELRGMWTMAAWLNHADSRGPNSLDTWVKGDGRSFVRHHLIDFSATLGAGPNGPRSMQTGTEYYVDYGVMSEAALTLGLKPFRWEPTVESGIPSVGNVEADTFDPEGWRPDYPNPAFDDRTDRDIRWGARIVSGFTDEHIRAAVGAAHYSDPAAADYITRVLIQRRDKLVGRWLGPNYTPVLAAE